LGFGFKFDKYLYPILAPFKSFSIPHQLLHAVLESYAGIALIIYKIFNKKTKTLLTLQSGKVSIPNFLFKKIHQTPDKVQAISKALAKRAEKFGAKNVEVIPNGVDLKEFQKRNIPKEKYRIVCVSHLKKVKGIEYLIGAMPKVLEKFPEAKLVLIGEGPERENLKTQISNLKIENSVEFKGALPHEKIPEELAKSEVFVLPSISEGMGIVIVEAQAVGIPVIGTNVGGIPDIIKNGENGILVEPKNPKELADAIIKIFSEPEFAQKLVKNAKVNLEKYDWQNIAQKVNSIYQELLR
jgi:glycosyltransferase involved in cell wall biosynthesis